MGGREKESRASIEKLILLCLCSKSENTFEKLYLMLNAGATPEEDQQNPSRGCKRLKQR
jgi:hypothetical protein